MDKPYTSLDSNEREIRLLELAPGSFDDDLVITLHVESLDHKLPQYHALSYAWGHELSARTALVNRNSMVIGQNLDGALRHLRCGLTEPAMLWVDAICINQQDIEERSSQVLLMKDIYSSAEHVRIYLGPEQPYDAWAAALIRNDEVPITENEIHALLTHVESICERPWFGRVWVAQELALSQRDPRAHIGTIILPWSRFYEYIVGLERRKPAFLDGHPRVTAFMQSMERMRRLGRVRAVPTTSLNLQVFRSAPALATDARDKVFGLLGICAFSPGQWAITPDYTKSMTRVFTEATISMLQEPQNIPYGLMPLQPPIRASGRLWYQRLPDLPSWVLDLNLSCHVNDQYCEMGPYWMIPERAVYPGKFLSKTSHIPDRVTIDQDFKYLRTPGLHLGTIVATYSSVVNLDSYMGFQNRATALRDVFRTYMKPRFIPAQTLLHAITVDRKTPVRDPQLSSRFLEVFAELLESETEITFPSPFFDILVALSGHEECTLFFTDDDRVGIAYHGDLDNGIRVGDEVVGLLGINFPFILRHSSADSGDGMVYTMVNLAHIANHVWEHEFLEDAGIDAQWSDYEDHGLRQYTIA
ncbi:hypothetical protein E8E13_001376 [Curvularia kusanoi]|uniref:Heterokaryon incompatibility domain-containing protein n=1 Tax=Curvularia kusanoi TaxID=90978 RepID=A0A9P4W6A9_CURKU|nr:hypothetical protein E8E13_001376 [Curvularia kusanoi]